MFMFLVLGILFVSTAIGMALRNVAIVKKLERPIAYTIYTMLFAFGITIGSNPDFFDNIGRYGIQAAVLSVAGIIGSIFASMLAWKILRKGGNYEK